MVDQIVSLYAKLLLAVGALASPIVLGLLGVFVRGKKVKRDELSAQQYIFQELISNCTEKEVKDYYKSWEKERRRLHWDQFFLDPQKQVYWILGLVFSSGFFLCWYYLIDQYTDIFKWYPNALKFTSLGLSMAILLVVVFILLKIFKLVVEVREIMENERHNIQSA